MNKINLTWDDTDVLPDKLKPDVAFLLQRMNDATYEMTAPQPAEIILDVGCGRALDIMNMARSGAMLLGLEPSSVMLSHARQSLKLDGKNTSILQAIGESIPVVPGSMDKIICKGALDHFADPDKAIQQMANALKPAGQVIISVANFDSLGFLIGKLVFWCRSILHIKNPYKRLPWELPPDHTIKLNYRRLVKMASGYLKIEKVTGVSMLCSMPGWGDMLSRLPEGISNYALKTLDVIAHILPCISDVIIIRCTRCQNPDKVQA